MRKVYTHCDGEGCEAVGSIEYPGMPDMQSQAVGHLPTSWTYLPSGWWSIVVANQHGVDSVEKQLCPACYEKCPWRHRR